MLESADPKQRLNALLLLREMGTAAVPLFIWALQDEDPSVRIAAVKSFVSLAAASEPAAVPLRIFWKQNRSRRCKADHLYPWTDGAIRD